MATVTVLPMARLFEGRAPAADPRPATAGRAAGTEPTAAVTAPVKPSARQIRAAGAAPVAAPSRTRPPRQEPTRRPTARRPRPTACDRSYEPDLHGSRLTRRGRVVVTLIWVAMAAAMAMMVIRPAEVPAPAETTTVVVQPGDTLWGVAAGIAPDGDRRVTISQIVELNGLRSAADIHPGDVLVVPARERS
jgi:nucleoid-associated protein YgaU